MTLLEVLKANVVKLGNLKIPARETELFTQVNEVAHDIRVCCQAMEQAEAERQAEAEQQAQQAEQNQEEPADEAHPE